MVDPIADMLTQIRNAQAVRKPEIKLSNSRVKFAIAKILKDEGFIKEMKVEEKNKILVVNLKYTENNMPVISTIKRISKSGQRIYIESRKIKKVLGGLGSMIISTSQGIMTGKEARKRNLGGEIICEVY